MAPLGSHGLCAPKRGGGGVDRKRTLRAAHHLALLVVRRTLLRDPAAVELNALDFELDLLQFDVQRDLSGQHTERSLTTA